MAVTSPECKTYRAYVARKMNIARAALKAAGNDVEQAIEILRTHWQAGLISYAAYLDAYLTLL